MASIVLAGSSSGSITVAAPAAAGSNTLTLPASTGTITTISTGGVSSNTGIGTDTLSANTTGANNVAVGLNALARNTEGIKNSALGSGALINNTTGTQNVAVGFSALTTAVSAVGNTAVGDDSLLVATGGQNTAMGINSGREISSGSNNLLLGQNAGRATSPSGSLTTADNRIVLGDNSITNAHIKVDWTVGSDERDKADITNFTHGLDYVNKLRPVNYVWDNRSDYKDKIRDGRHKQDIVDLGFLAQEIKKIEADLGIDNHAIVDSTNPDSLGMKTSKLIPVLVNAIQELSAEVNSLKEKLKGDK